MAKAKKKSTTKKKIIAKKTTKRRSPAPVSKRTTHRSKAGKKLYAVRDKEGQFKDIQTFERAHGQDIQRDAAAEM